VKASIIVADHGLNGPREALAPQADRCDRGASAAYRCSARLTSREAPGRLQPEEVDDHAGSGRLRPPPHQEGETRVDYGLLPPKSFDRLSEELEELRLGPRPALSYT
jgi:hypothetical protein